MRRRDLSKILAVSATGAALLPKQSQAQSCTLPCYPQTAAEAAANVIPTNTSYVPGDVRRYGALGDNSHDDTTAIQAAVNQAANVGPGAQVFIPEGVHKITNTIVISHPTSIKGIATDLGAGGSIRCHNTSVPALSFTAASAGHSIESIAIRYESTPQLGATGIQINQPTSYNGSGLTPFRVENVFISNAYNGIHVLAGSNLYFLHLTLVGFQNDAFKCENATGTYIAHAYFGGAANADFEATDCAGLEMVDVQAYHGSNGFKFTHCSQIFLTGLISDTTTNDGIVFDNVDGATVSNSWSAGSSGGHGIKLTNTNNFMWSGGFIRGNNKSGLLIESGCKNISLTGASLAANGHLNTTSSDKYGINVNQAMTNLRVVGCVFGDVGEDEGNTAQTHALFFNTAASATANSSVIQGNQVVNCLLTNSYTNPWVIAGSNTEVNWVAGGGAPTAASRNGCLYSDLSTGSLYARANGAWRKVAFEP